MIESTDTRSSSKYFGYVLEGGATQRLVTFDPSSPERELRIEVDIPPNGNVVIDTFQRPPSGRTRKRVAAVSAAISASLVEDLDHDAARREVDRALEVDWPVVSILVDGTKRRLHMLRLLSGNWAGYMTCGGVGVSLGTSNVDIRRVHLESVNPLSLQGDAQPE